MKLGKFGRVALAAGALLFAVQATAQAPSLVLVTISGSVAVQVGGPSLASSKVEIAVTGSSAAPLVEGAFDTTQGGGLSMPFAAVLANLTGTTSLTLTLKSASTCYPLINGSGQTATVTVTPSASSGTVGSGGITFTPTNVDVGVLTIGTGTVTCPGAAASSGTGSNGNSSSSTAGSTTATGSLDVNGDGVVDQKDLDVVRAALRGETPVTKAMDLNGDGVVSTLDAIILIRAIRGSIPPVR